jgi:hypothetical protein
MADSRITFGSLPQLHVRRFSGADKERKERMHLVGYRDASDALNMRKHREISRRRDNIMSWLGQR